MNQPHFSLEELDVAIKAAREGDLAAFERIVFFFERPLFGYVSRMISVREDAEDIVQECFIKMYKKLSTYNPDQSFKTWVYAIATNTVYDFLRSKRVKKESLTLDAHEADSDSGQNETKDLSDTYEIIEREMDISRGLVEIKPAYRTVLLLFYKEELSCDAIADMLQIPIGTVKTNLFRARKALKLALGDIYSP